MKAKKAVKQARNKYSPEFKKQVLDRAEKDGIAVTARDLNLKESQLYAWRQKRRLEGLTTEEQKLQQSELARLKREVARLEEEAAFLKKAAAYFAKLPK
jgi:transposase